MNALIDAGLVWVGIDDRRPESMRCRSSGDTCVAELEFWNLTVRCTMSFVTRTLETHSVKLFRLAHGPGEQFSGFRLLLGEVASGAFRAE